MLVNAYQLYRTACRYIWCVPVKDIISQYEFRKQICLSWLNQHNYRDHISPQSGLRSNISVPCVHSHKLNVRNKDDNVQKAPRVTVRSLSLRGSLGIRLDKSVQHLPLSNVKDLRKHHLVCSVHRWVDRRIRFKDTVMVCSHCKVALCLWCYAPFHSIVDVSELRKVVEKTITINDHCKHQHN